MQFYSETSPAAGFCLKFGYQRATDSVALPAGIDRDLSHLCDFLKLHQYQAPKKLPIQPCAQMTLVNFCFQFLGTEVKSERLAQYLPTQLNSLPIFGRAVLNPVQKDRHTYSFTGFADWSSEVIRTCKGYVRILWAESGRIVAEGDAQIMLKLFWAMILAGSAFVAYPHLTHKEKFHESFSEIAIDSLEYPRAVKVLPLEPSKDSGSLQAYLFGTVVTREYTAPPGWAKGFQGATEPLQNSASDSAPQEKDPKPQFVVRFEGRMGTVDVIVCSKTNRLWYLERGRLRPFYSRSSNIVGSTLEPLIRSALPSNVSSR